MLEQELKTRLEELGPASASTTSSPRRSRSGFAPRRVSKRSSSGGPRRSTSARKTSEPGASHRASGSGSGKPQSRGREESEEPRGHDRDARPGACEEAAALTAQAEELAVADREISARAKELTETEERLRVESERLEREIASGGEAASEALKRLEELDARELALAAREAELGHRGRTSAASSEHTKGRDLEGFEQRLNEREQELRRRGGGSKPRRSSASSASSSSARRSGSPDSRRRFASACTSSSSASPRSRREAKIEADVDIREERVERQEQSVAALEEKLAAKEKKLAAYVAQVRAR